MFFLQWGRSNLVDPAEGPIVSFLNRDFGNILSIFPGKAAKPKFFFSPDSGNIPSLIFRDWHGSGEVVFDVVFFLPLRCCFAPPSV